MKSQSTTQTRTVSKLLLLASDGRHDPGVTMNCPTRSNVKNDHHGSVTSRDYHDNVTSRDHHGGVTSRDYHGGLTSSFNLNNLTSPWQRVLITS